MSRIAKEPVPLPQGVEVNQSGTSVSLKGSKGSLSMELNSEVEVKQDDGALQVSPRSGSRFQTQFQALHGRCLPTWCRA